jgi:hypothetical protein
VATWRLPGRGRLDLGLVDALARLHLAARRHGWTVNLAEVDPELDALLGFTGLAEVLGGVLPLEAGRETEGLEGLRAEEVVPGGDPPA